MEWYFSDANLHPDIVDEVQGQKMIHMRIELPYTSKPTFVTDPEKALICLDLDSELAIPFFGKYFVDRYREFIFHNFNQLG
jgi:hypothetical protein